MPKNLLINNKATLLKLAQALRDKETLDGVEIEAIIQGDQRWYAKSRDGERS